MAKLYPPYIDSNIVAQSGEELNIPFRFNRAVSANEVSGASILIKSAATNTQIELQGNTITVEVEEDKTQGIVKVKGSSIKNVLNIGSYYKIQVALNDKSAQSTTGYYSSVGVFKYTTMPQLTLEANRYNCTGSYTNSDSTEKQYSYIFNLYDENDNLIETSGMQLHNFSLGLDTDNYNIKYNLQNNKSYSAEYQVITQNGLIARTAQSIGTTAVSANPLPLYSLLAFNDYDEGRISVILSDYGNYYNSSQESKLRIIRTCSKNDYSTFEVMQEITLPASKPLPKQLYYDYTVEQGQSYKYSVQFQNGSSWTSQLESDAVRVDFEDMFLYDGELQLKIKFNPKVSSFKETVLESKTDTIGGRYPRFYRNGNTNYKEFNISGLISYHLDETELFMTNKELGFDTFIPSRTSTSGQELKISTRSTNLNSDNFYAERQFKNKVLSWLNNGKPKLFRSSAEGNYLVRLMNITLSPNDQLGRMIHTFNSMAYEIADCTIDNMRQNNLLFDRIVNETVVSSNGFNQNTANKLLSLNTFTSISLDELLQIGSIFKGPEYNYSNETLESTYYVDLIAKISEIKLKTANVAMAKDIVKTIRYTDEVGNTQEFKVHQIDVPSNPGLRYYNNIIYKGQYYRTFKILGGNDENHYLSTDSIPQAISNSLFTFRISFKHSDQDKVISLYSPVEIQQMKFGIFNQKNITIQEDIKDIKAIYIGRSLDGTVSGEKLIWRWSE